MIDKIIAFTKNFIRKLMPMGYIFSRVYRTHRFGGKISASGPGSDLAQTEAVRQVLLRLIRELGVKTMLDAPCGDYYWMRNIRLDIDRYIGVDIVSDIIKQNHKNYGSRDIEFLKLNIVKDRLPKTDLILCRDCLVHFSFKDIFAAINNFKRSGSVYLLTTTFPQHSVNTDIPTGSWQPLNLESAPFNFPKPIRLLCESCTEEGDKYRDKCLGLWKVGDLNINKR